MTRLGYTFYPKDFISDPDVMMMDSSERGIYRDLIDLAYMNDNKIKYSIDKIARYCNSDSESVKKVLELKGKLIGKYWSIPSCDKRIAKANVNRENAKKRGRPPKPKNNPTNNPNLTQNERQREREREREYVEDKNIHKSFDPIKQIQIDRDKEISEKENIGKSHFQYLKKNYTSTLYEKFLKSELHTELRKLPLKEQNELVTRFEAKCLEDGIEYDGSKIYGRLQGYARTWIKNHNENNNKLKKGML